MDLLCLKGCDISICRSNGLKFCLLLLIIIWQIILRFRTWGYVLRLSRKRKMIWTEKSKIWKRNVRLWFYSHVMSLFLPKTSLFIVIFWAFWSYTCYLKTSGKLFFFLCTLQCWFVKQNWLTSSRKWPQIGMWKHLSRKSWNWGRKTRSWKESSLTRKRVSNVGKPQTNNSSFGFTRIK